MFNPGDLVQLSASALMENIRRGGQLFPNLTAESILIVKSHKGRAVSIDTESTTHSIIHESWLVPAFEQEQAVEQGQELHGAD